jgi:hypothetical protein
MRSAMSALTSCLTHVPQFLSPHLSVILGLSCHPVFVDQSPGADGKAASRAAQIDDLRLKVKCIPIRSYRCTIAM